MGGKPAFCLVARRGSLCSVPGFIIQAHNSTKGNDHHGALNCPPKRHCPCPGCHISLCFSLGKNAP